jgi:membrane-bound lytic murein transglycosylase C
MKRPHLIFVLIILVLFSASILGAEDPFEKLNKDYEAQVKAMQRQYQDQRLDMEKQWAELEKEQDETWARLKAEAERKWQAFVHSTKKDWVDYSTDKDSRSKVDFDNGKIVLEAVVSKDDPEALTKARRKIERQIEKILRQTGVANKRILENQLVTGQGDKVTFGNMQNYIEKEVLPRLIPSPQTFKAKDGVERRKYSVDIDLVPNHIRLRSERYLPVVQKNAKRFGLKPQLILAVMHTESYFNPRAVSGSKAIGIMQIIPKYAGREAYRSIYGQDKLISWDYLFVPENNIELGAAYLSLLKYNHFKDIHNETKNHYVAIAGYNWGPTAMRRKIVDRYPIAQMSNEQVYSLLRQKTPLETKNYIKRVTERMSIYDPYFR